MFSACLLFGFSFLQWSPNIWCEQMWKRLMIVKMMEMLQS